MDLTQFIVALNTSGISKYQLESENGNYSLMFSSYPPMTDEQIYKVISLIQFPNLVSLTVSLKNHLHFQYLVETLDGNHSLKKLDLSHSEFLSFPSLPWSADIQAKYVQLTHLWQTFWNLDLVLEELHLNNCQVELDVFKAMVPNTDINLKIKKFFLNNNPLGNPTLDFISRENISGWNMLEHLEVENCGFRGDSVDFHFTFLGQLPILKTFKIGYNSIGDNAFILLFDDLIYHRQLGTVSLRKSGIESMASFEHCLSIISANSNIINFDIRNNNFLQHTIVNPLIPRNLSIGLYYNRLRSILALILAGRKNGLPRLPSEVWEQLIAHPYLWEEIPL